MNSAEVLKSTDSDTYAKNIKATDLDLINIVKQVCEITGCSHDVAATVLFDSNYDIERAVDKIFDHPVQTIFEESNHTSNVWKEVAKSKKKAVAAEVVQPEININTEIEINENKLRVIRGSGRGRARNVRNNGRTFDNNNDTMARNVMRGRGHRSQIRLTTNRGRSKPHYNQDYTLNDPNLEVDSDSDSRHVRVSNEWLSDDVEPDTIVETEVKIPLATLNISAPEYVPNPVEIVAKYSSKDGVFGDYSRTKAPPPSSIVPNEPIKLVTSTGFMSLPLKTAFHFGLDFSEYCDGGSALVHSDNAIPRLLNEDDIAPRRIHCEDNVIRRVHGDDNVSKRVHDENSIPKRIHVDDNTSRRSQDTHTPTSPTTSLHHSSDSALITSSFKTTPQCLSDNSYTAATILPPSAQLCPPPGMSNAHILQQIHNPQYLSLMNVQNGPSIFDLTEMVSSTSSNDQQMHHSVDSKDFLPKTHTTKTHSDHEHSAVLNAMQMPNICCFPQVYMNNFANFLPTVPGHSSAGQTIDNNTKPLYTQRNYVQQNDDMCEGVKYDDAVTGKHKYPRNQNYGSNYGGKDENHDNDKMKMNSGQGVRGQPLGQGRPNQQAMPNDPRLLTFHHPHQGHPYQNNMYNCVTAPGPHQSGAHPYAMAHQASGMPQLHHLQLLQQQMQNFPQSYQFQEQHLMTPMVPNANNRNNSGSNNNQSRNGRSNNTLWHPSN